MGARKGPSSILALELLTSSVQAAWDANPDCIVSMLGLDIKGAFDNISKERLFWVLEREGFHDWIINCVSNFITNRRTRICFAGNTSHWIQTQVRIPQGSYLSPILFLFYTSKLLDSLQQQ